MSSKRSRSIQLLVMGSAPLLLVACSDGTEVKTIKKDERFVKPQDCIQAGKPADVCTESYMTALKRHKEIAPKYEKVEDCESDFMKDYCVKGEDGKFAPKMAGFSLVSEQKQLINSSSGLPVVNQNTDSNGFLTGLVLGNLAGNMGGTTHYYSEPVYKRRDDRGSGYSTNTMSGYASSGIRPSKSIQAQAQVNAYSNKSSSNDYKSTRSATSGSGYGDASRSNYNTGYSGSSSKSAYNSGYSKPSSSNISVSKTTSRGGFGGVSAARGGWGGGGGS
ncbi:MAG: DUF1190 domain-containing protein [Hafnia sp.]